MKNLKYDIGIYVFYMDYFHSLLKLHGLFELLTLYTLITSGSYQVLTLHTPITSNSIHI